MGVTVRQKVKGRGKPWWVFVAHNGKRKSKQVGDKEAAEKVASAIRAKIKKGDFGLEEDKPLPTFKHYADLWIETTVRATCKESTLKDYKDILRLHVLPVFGHIPISEVTRGKIKDFLLTKVNGGYAKSTVSHMKDVVSGVLGKALDDELIVANPTHKMGKIFKVQEIKKAINPFSAEELQLLLNTVEKHYREHYPLFLLLARTGLRIGEALGLQWGDIDFSGRFIEIKRSLVRGKISTPKNGKTRRVDMSLQLTEVLETHMIEMKKKGIALGLGCLPKYTFINEKGGSLDKDNWRRRIFNKSLLKAGLRKIRIHDLRHTYSTLRINAGHNITDVSGQLGHHSVKLTLDTYNHWLPGKQKSEIDSLDSLHLPTPIRTLSAPTTKKGVSLMG